MKTIKLTNGQETIVDEDIYLKYKNKKFGLDINGYVRTWYFNRQRQKTETFWLHKLIMGKTGVIDHINGNILDNRRQNLRITDRSGNAINAGKQKGKYTSIYRGVSFMKRKNKWRAYAEYKKKLIHIGSFNTEIEAAIARDNFWRTKNVIFVPNIKE